VDTVHSMKIKLSNSTSPKAQRDLRLTRFASSNYRLLRLALGITPGAILIAHMSNLPKIKEKTGIYPQILLNYRSYG
jgi:hypothetical protein